MRLHPCYLDAVRGDPYFQRVRARSPSVITRMLAPSCAIGAICGLGVDGYEYALRALMTSLRVLGVNDWGIDAQKK